MKNWRAPVFGTVLLLVASGVGVLALSNGSLPSSEAALSYSVGGCEENSERQGSISSYGEVEVTIMNQSVVIRHYLNYVCCAALKLDWSMDGNLISLTETNTGEMCRCVCNYDVNASIGPLPPGKYLVAVYGVGYQNIEPSLLAQEETEVAP